MLVNKERYIYTDVAQRELKDVVGQLAEKSINSSFGICFVLRGDRMRVIAISPSSAGLSGSTVRPVEHGVFESYEGYMTESPFLPLRSDVNKGIDYHLSNLRKFMLPDEKVVVQFMFRKLIGSQWRRELLDMFCSYLSGNDSPLSSSIGRRLQDRTIGFIGGLGNFELSKEYVPEAEDKILDVGYEFQMAVGIKSKETDRIIERVTELFKKYDFYNSIRIHKVGLKDDILTFRSGKSHRLRKVVPESIIGEKELYTLLVGSSDAGDVHMIEDDKGSQSEATEKSVFSFLPEHVIDTKSGIYPELDKESLVARIARALSIVKVISTARIYNEEVIEGVRLIIVQFSIPKGKNLSHIQKKRSDIQAALGVASLSIEQGDSPNTVKFILPNNRPRVISLREIIELSSFHEFRHKDGNDLAFVAGVDEIGNPIYLSLSRLVHLLIAGTVGSGKSVFINSLAVALLSTHSPEELQMIMIDPKRVEMQHYRQIPHVREVLTDMDEAERALEGLTAEMDRRYEEFERVGVKSIQLYNENDKREGKMPYLVCIIDEYADLKDMHKEVDNHVGRLGQLARAAGIHLVIATQRPDAKILGGRIKAVIPNAISFNLNNNIDYQTVFGTGIDDTVLLGRGDGIMKIEGYKKRLQRFQGCMISVDESKEEKVYKDLAKIHAGSQIVENTQSVIVDEVIPDNKPPSRLNELKRVIATTRETRIAPLRSELGIRAETLTGLMTELVDEGWLFKHDSKARGYELVASEEELARWR